MKKLKLRNLFSSILSPILTITPIITLAGCNNPGEKSETEYARGTENSIIDQIKKQLNEEFVKNPTPILDHNYFNELNAESLFNILNEIARDIKNVETTSEIINNKIKGQFTKNINAKLVELNKSLKSIYPVLENLDSDVVSLENNSLFLEKLTYNEFIGVLEKLKPNNLVSSHQLNSSDSQSSLYKVNLNLTFNITIDGHKDNSYALNNQTYYITDNAEDISNKISEFSNLLSGKLKNQEINLIDMLDIQGNIIKNIDEKFIQLVKQNFNDNNQGLTLQFDRLAAPIKKEDLRLELKSLKYDIDNGEYYKSFVNVIMNDEINMIHSMYTNNIELQNLNDGRAPTSGLVKIKKFSYTPLNLLINNIKIPMVKPIEIFLVLDKTKIIEYLEQFRLILQKYFELIKAPDIRIDTDGRNTKSYYIEKAIFDKLYELPTGGYNPNIERFIIEDLIFLL